MIDTSFRDYALDQLRGLGEVRARPMFGGHGLYHGDRFFGAVWRDRLFLKVDDASRPAYIARGMGPMRPSEHQTMESYYEVPADILDDADALVEWARRAIDIEPAPKRPSARRRSDGSTPPSAESIP